MFSYKKLEILPGACPSLCAGIVKQNYYSYSDLVQPLHVVQLLVLLLIQVVDHMSEFGMPFRHMYSEPCSMFSYVNTLQVPSFLYKTFCQLVVTFDQLFASISAGSIKNFSCCHFPSGYQTNTGSLTMKSQLYIKWVNSHIFHPFNEKVPDGNFRWVYRILYGLCTYILPYCLHACMYANVSIMISS